MDKRKMELDLFDAAVWEQAWKEDMRSMGNRMKRSGVDMTRSFDTKAVSFNQEVFSEEGRRRSERIIRWIEGQNIDLAGLRVLDIGAASGGFSVPFAERGAWVTAVEPNRPLLELLRENTAELNREETRVDIVPLAFEDIDLAAQGWLQAYDLVFVSMCPTITDWASVERVLACAKQYSYISLAAGGREHSLLNEVMPLVEGRETGMDLGMPDMGYLQQLLYLKGYAYEAIVTQEMKTTDYTPDKAVDEALALLRHSLLPSDHPTRSLVADYIKATYGDGPVPVSQGGRYGKVLVRLQEQSMYSRGAYPSFG